MKVKRNFSIIIIFVAIVLTVSVLILIVKSNNILDLSFKGTKTSIDSKKDPRFSSDLDVRYPKADTALLQDIFDDTDENSYVMSSVELNMYSNLEMYHHKAGDDYQKYTNPNCWLNYKLDSCYKFYEITTGQNDLYDVLSLNYKEGTDLYTMILTPTSEREIYKKIIDDKLFDLPRLDNIEARTILDDIDKEFTVLLVGNTLICSLDPIVKPKLDAFFTWFEGKYLATLKQNPVNVFPSDIPEKGNR